MPREERRSLLRVFIPEHSHNLCHDCALDALVLRDDRHDATSHAAPQRTRLSLKIGSQPIDSVETSDGVQAFEQARLPTSRRLSCDSKCIYVELQTHLDNISWCQVILYSPSVIDSSHFASSSSLPAGCNLTRAVECVCENAAPQLSNSWQYLWCLLTADASKHNKRSLCSFWQLVQRRYTRCSGNPEAECCCAPISI